MFDLLAADADRPGVAPVDPRQDLHEGRLAGAVLADEGVDLARPQLELGPVERVDARERLADPVHLDEQVVGEQIVGLGLRCHPRFVAPG